VRCPLAWLSIALGLAALALTFLRVHELALRAPLAARPFARRLGELIEAGDLAAAQRLCARLLPGWGAQLAGAALREWSDPATVDFALDEAFARLELRAQRHLNAIRTLGRMALPLALGSAIVELGLGFGGDPGSALAASTVQAALDCALRALATGFATVLFCPLASAFLQRQSLERLEEARIVAEMLASQMSRMTR
jgi:biopolymer transport protein ExbB/TolQ